MGVLFWGEPEMVPASYSRTGHLVMSREAKSQWKATYLPKKDQIEIRRLGMVIVVSLDGYWYKKYYRTGKHTGKTRFQKENARIHIASSEPQQLTWEEWHQMVSAIEEAKIVLVYAKENKKEVEQLIQDGRIDGLCGK